MLIDLHCHTLPLSQCSALQPAVLAVLARERGLDGICLTEHDAFWPEAELEELRRAHPGLRIFTAVELSTDMGHILAFGLRSGSAALATAAGAFEAATRDGGLLYLAHPARDGLLRVDRHTVEYFESVEAINGSDSRLQNVAATGLAHGFRLPGIGGSDAHTPAEIGRAATLFEEEFEDDAGLLAALRSGAYRAVTME
jgi:predicted metal-dependent phosphoesterase TrpH